MLSSYWSSDLCSSDLAVKHGLKQVSVADLIAYRQRKETLIQLASSFTVETPYGPAMAHAYSLPWDPMQHLAVVFGDIRDGVDIPVRLHLEPVGRDVFGQDRQIDEIMQRIAARSAARRVGEACGCTCSARWTTCHY